MEISFKISSRIKKPLQFVLSFFVKRDVPRAFSTIRSIELLHSGSKVLGSVGTRSARAIFIMARLTLEVMK